MPGPFEITTFDLGVKARKATNPINEPEGTMGFLRAWRDGTLAAMEWKQLLVFEGRCFHTFDGVFSTPGAGGGALAPMESIRPRLGISVPVGTIIMPLRIKVDLQMPLLATDSDESEAMIAVDRTQAIGATTWTATALVPENLKTLGLNRRTTACTVKKTATADLSPAPVYGMELAHVVKVGDVQGVAATTMWTGLELLYEPKASPLIVGPAGLFVLFGGTVATTGFVTCEWAEFNVTELGE